MDHYAENPTQPSINFSHLADKFLLANGTMVAFKNKLDLQSETATGNRLTSHSSQYSDEISNFHGNTSHSSQYSDEISKHHGNASHSSQYSEEGYVTTGTLESEYEIDSKDNIGCMTSGQLVDEGLSGYVPAGYNGSSYIVLDNRPSPVLQTLDNDHVLQNVEYTVPQQHESKDMDKPSAKACRPRSRMARPPLLPPCRVCGDRASGFHYGVNTCEACKGFFRRSINKCSEAYTCVGNGSCKLVPGKRTACSACRYHRCLEVGMSKSKIKTGRYTHELRSRNIMEVKKLQQQNSIETVSNICENICAAMETEEKPEPLPNVKDKDFEKLLQVLIEGQKSLYEFLDDYYNEELMYSRQLAVYERYMKSKSGSSNGKHTPLQDTPTCKTTSVSPYPPVATILQYPVHVDIVKQEPDSNSTVEDSYNTDKCINSNRAVSDTDHSHAYSCEKKGAQFENCSSDIKTEVPSQFVSGSHQSGLSGDTWDTKTRCGTTSTSVGGDGQSVDKSEEKKKAEVLFQVLQDMERGVQGMLSFTRCLPGLEDLPREDQAAMLKASRFDIWYIGHIRCFNTELFVGACEWQFHGEELAKVWGSELMELAFRLSRVGQALNLTKEEVAVLRAVCLTFPDRCYPLTERDKVEDIHNNMLELFRYVSKKRHKNFNTWFSKVINFLTIMREFGILFEKTSSCLKLDWSVLNENPYLLEVFLS